MFFRGDQKKNTKKNKTISLPGKFFTCRNSAPRRFGVDFRERAAFCISAKWKKASLTVEAAFALPLFFLTVISLMSLMEIYGQFAGKMLELQQKAEEQAIWHIYRKEESSIPIRLGENVKTELILLPFHAGEVKVRVMSSVLPWTGRSDYSGLDHADSEQGRLYYLSDYQSVYHTSSSCSYLSLQISAVAADRVNHARNDHGEKYDACEKCVGSGNNNSLVYITPNGDHYHNSSECSGLKRSVHLVEEDAIEGLSLCTRCRKREGTP